jgi:hypothetical protein
MEFYYGFRGPWWFLQFFAKPDIVNFPISLYRVLDSPVYSVNCSVRVKQRKGSIYYFLTSKSGSAFLLGGKAIMRGGMLTWGKWVPRNCFCSA